MRKLFSGLAALIIGCGSSTPSEPGTIALTLDTPSGTIAQGSHAAVSATLVRSGGFTGAVTITAAGPAGVTGTVGNLVTNGATTTATVDIAVSATTPTGVYPITVHATGTGVSETTATFQLTVQLPASFALSLSQATITGQQGGATLATTVTIDRTNFSGPVTLSVDNLPQGVSAIFPDGNPVTANSSSLILSVANAAVPGTFSNLMVRGTAPAPGGVIDRAVALSLIVLPVDAGYALTLSDMGVETFPGGVATAVPYLIDRTNFAGVVAVSVEGLPAGVTAAVSPPTSGPGGSFTLSVGGAVNTGSYALTLRGTTDGLADRLFSPFFLGVNGITPGNYELVAPQAPVTVAQGAQAVTTLTILRTGGNTSSVAVLPFGSLPAGMSLGFAPQSTTGSSIALTITTTSATPLGSQVIGVSSLSTPLGAQIVGVTVNVVAP